MKMSNILKKQVFHKIKYVLRGHRRSHKVTFLFKIPLFLRESYQTVYKLKCDLNGRIGPIYVDNRLSDLFYFKFSDLITTLTYLLMENFCHLFY